MDAWWKPARCNCVVWALVMLRRFGGGLYLRGSYYKRFLFHMAWVPYPGAPQREIVGYCPNIPKPGGFDAPWFWGHVSDEATELERARQTGAPFLHRARQGMISPRA